MLNPFICGSFNHHQDTEYEEHLPCSNSPRRSKKHHHNPNKNPYSSRGLDKFSALLAQLDEKKQQIYSQMDAQDISLVRFAYSKTNDFVPIVVKLKDHRNQNLEHLDNPQKLQNQKDKVFNVFSEDTKHVPRLSEENRGDSDRKTEKQGRKQRMVSWCLEFFSPCNWKRPSGYLPVILILILCFLTVFGRSFTVMCTCLGWYLVPTLQELTESSKISMKKMKQQQPPRRFLSENRRSFNPRNFKNDNKSPPKLRHQKSSLK